MDAKKLLTGISVFVVATSTVVAAPIHLTLGAVVVGQTNSVSPRKQSDELLRQARSAMNAGRYDLARQKIDEAEKLGVAYKGLFQRFGDTPSKVRKDLEKLARTKPVNQPAANGLQTTNVAAEESPGPLVNPNKGARRTGYPNGYPNSPPNQLDARQNQTIGDSFVPPTGNRVKSQVSNLMTQSQTAMQQGKLNAAEQWARQAYALNLPDSQFGPNEIRPAMLLAEIDRIKRKSSQVAPASHPETTNGFDVAQAIYQDQGQPVYVQPVANLRNLAIQETHGANQDSDPFLNDPPAAPAAPNSVLTNETPSSLGIQLINDGQAALQQNDIESARQLFLEAWKHERELDPPTRQRLQDHLQLLGMKNGATETRPVAESLTEGEQAIVRRFVNEISREQASAERNLQRTPKDTWQRLTDLRDRVNDAEIPGSAQQQLLARIDRSLNQTEQYIERNRARISQDERNREVIEKIDRRRNHRLDVDDKLAKLVDQFNTLMDQQRYAEAMVRANQAAELDPDSELVQSMIWKSRFAERLAVELSIRDRMQQRVETALRDVSKGAVPYDESNLLEFPEQGNVRYWRELTDRRLKRTQGQRRSYSETELAIQRALRENVRVEFSNMSLGSVLGDLAKIAGVSIYLDPNGLDVEGITSDQMVTINLNQEIKLKSALNLILEPFNLTYVIQDEVLKITSKDISDKKTVVATYDVADLVVPIPNFTSGYDSGMAGALREAFNAQAPKDNYRSSSDDNVTVPIGPFGSNQQLPNDTALAQFNSPGGQPSSGLSSIPGLGPGGMGGAAQADFDTLIELITATISPDSWEEVGGEGSIQGFPTNLSLVVSNTQEVHEQITDLLDQLRKLQDLQVTIEVRFITLNDNFFERIGVDFDFDIDDDVLQVPDDDDGPSVTIGLDPFGNPTADLDMSFVQDSFGATRPQFGGFDVGTAGTFGFAILSDIEAFFLIEASQGDRRTNVLQAPKVTLFNGQQATVSDQSTRPFVTSVTPVVGDFAAAQQPIILVLAEGTQLNVQAVVSPDRRFVRLTLVPFFSEIGDVEEFTFEGRRTSSTGTAVIDPTNDTQTIQNNADDFVEGTTVQLPQFAFTSVSTTVSVPDGGTILLGGIKRLSEGRDEQGIPMLGKIPYVNRLFKNVGIGRTTQSLMMMVTPRIIIQEEEEERLGISLP